MADKDTAGDQEDREERDEKREARVVAAPSVRPAAGFLSFYKKGQGYWTRMGTAAGAALVAFVLAAFFFERMKIWIVRADGRPQMGVILAILGAAVAVLGLWVFRMLNKPSIVDFLIATESEMKKVNWTTRKELIGSTKVVILFMLLIAVLLFMIDIGFGYFFKLIRVLQFGPFGGE